MLNKPNLFVVGAAKAGTTAVFNYLNAHPEIFMSSIKEPNFFGSDIRWENFREDHKANTKFDFDEYFSKQKLVEKHIAFIENEHHYLALFRNSRNFKIRGEASTSYLYSTVAAQEIYDFNPDAKIIIILREPVDRTVSHYLMDYARGNQTGVNVLEDLKNDYSTFKKGYCISNLYIDLSLYSAQINRYNEIFPMEQLLIMSYEDLKKDPAKFMSHIYSFLQIKDEEINIHKSFNATQEPKNNFIKGALIIKKFLPKTILELFRSKKSLFFKPVSKELVSEECLRYLKGILDKDWRKVKPLIKRI